MALGLFVAIQVRSTPTSLQFREGFWVNDYGEKD
jgi:hypothetical protein